MLRTLTVPIRFRLTRLIISLLAITLAGAFGFKWIEGWEFADGLYMALITLTTVGYGEVHPLSRSGQWFVMIYLIVGLGLSLYLIAQISESIIRTRIFQWLDYRGRKSVLKGVVDHYVVCGYGRMGQKLCRQLRRQGIPVVAIENLSSADLGAEADSCGVDLISGDATRDEVLARVNLEKARGLAAVLGSDADNLFIVLSARLINPKLKIIARANRDENVAKLQKAGADKVVSPYATGARKIAQLLSHPELSEIIDWGDSEGGAMELAEIEVKPNSPFANQTLAQVGLENQKFMPVAVRRKAGQYQFPIPFHEKLVVGDHVIAIGDRSAIEDLLSR